MSWNFTLKNTCFRAVSYCLVCVLNQIKGSFRLTPTVLKLHMHASSVKPPTLHFPSTFRSMALSHHSLTRTLPASSLQHLAESAVANTCIKNILNPKSSNSVFYQIRVLHSGLCFASSLHTAQNRKAGTQPAELDLKGTGVTGRENDEGECCRMKIRKMI